MKRITAIVRPEKMEKLKDALFEVDVNGMTISQVQGCGNQHGWSEYVRGTEVLLNMLPKVKFELVVEDEAADELVDLICDTAATGEVGDGKVFVSPVEEVIREYGYKGKVEIQVNSTRGLGLQNATLHDRGLIYGYNSADDTTKKLLPVSSIKEDSSGSLTVCFGRLDDYYYA